MKVYNVCLTKTDSDCRRFHKIFENMMAYKLNKISYLITFMVFARHILIATIFLHQVIHGALIEIQCSIAIFLDAQNSYDRTYILMTSMHAAATSSLCLVFLTIVNFLRQYSIFLHDNKNTMILEQTFLNTSRIFAKPFPTLYFTFANVRHYTYFAIRKSQLFHKHYI